MNRFLKTIKNNVIYLKRDIRSTYYIKKNCKKINNSIIKVGFIVYEPESWDKLQPIYEKMLESNDFNPSLIVVPVITATLQLTKSYSYEKEFFERKYGDVLLAYDSNGEVINLEKYGFDYIFYQAPYMTHFPEKLRSYEIAKYSKVCYIPYGYTISQNFSELLYNNRLFLRNVRLYFAESDSVKDVAAKVIGKNYLKGIQKVLTLGFPSIEYYMNISPRALNRSITWAPRWSYDEKVGGSHFLEYKDNLIDLKSEIDEEVSINIRPHPLLFSNLIEKKIMSQEELDEYLGKLETSNINIKDKQGVYEVFNETDILISDISSVIPSFFVSGKPIIFCKSSLPINYEFSEMLKGIYIAESWEDVKRYVFQLLDGVDPLKTVRKEIIENGIMSVHRGATVRILECLKNECRG